eukprot:tig00020610_g11946.t1
MASDLARQLAGLSAKAAVGPAPIPGLRGKASILFTPQEAAELDLESIHSLGLGGLGELEKLDARFQEYERSLFSAKAKETNRELQTKEENKKLDDAIAGVLRLLSNYFLQKPAHRVFEYLVRRFKVNEYNVNDVMRCILPYHETNIFVRVVQILRLPGDSMSAIRNQGLLSFVCESTQAAVGAGTAGATSFSFAVALVVEVLHRVGRPQPDLVSRVLPLVIDGLRASGNADFQCAAYMILGAIATRAPLDAKGVATLGELLAKHAPQDAADSPAALTCLVLLCETQGPGALSVNAFRFASKFAGLAPALAALSERHAIGAFLGPSWRTSSSTATPRQLPRAAPRARRGPPAAALRPTRRRRGGRARAARGRRGRGGGGRGGLGGAPPTARLPLPRGARPRHRLRLGAAPPPPPPAGQEGGGGGALGGPQAAAGGSGSSSWCGHAGRHAARAGGGGAGTTLLLALEHPEAGVRLAALERVPEDPAPATPRRSAPPSSAAPPTRSARRRRALRHPPSPPLQARRPPRRAGGTRRLEPRGGRRPRGVAKATRSRARGGAPAAAAAPWTPAAAKLSRACVQQAPSSPSSAGRPPSSEAWRAPSRPPPRPPPPPSAREEEEEEGGEAGGRRATCKARAEGLCVNVELIRRLAAAAGPTPTPASRPSPPPPRRDGPRGRPRDLALAAARRGHDDRTAWSFARALLAPLQRLWETAPRRRRRRPASRPPRGRRGARPAEGLPPLETSRPLRVRGAAAGAGGRRRRARRARGAPLRLARPWALRPPGPRRAPLRRRRRRRGAAVLKELVAGLCGAASFEGEARSCVDAVARTLPPGAFLDLLALLIASHPAEVPANVRVRCLQLAQEAAAAAARAEPGSRAALGPAAARLLPAACVALAAPERPAAAAAGSARKGSSRKAASASDKGGRGAAQEECAAEGPSDAALDALLAVIAGAPDALAADPAALPRLLAERLAARPRPRPPAGARSAEAPASDVAGDVVDFLAAFALRFDGPAAGTPAPPSSPPSPRPPRPALRALGAPLLEEVGPRAAAAASAAAAGDARLLSAVAAGGTTSRAASRRPECAGAVHRALRALPVPPRPSPPRSASPPAAPALPSARRRPRPPSGPGARRRRLPTARFLGFGRGRGALGRGAAGAALTLEVLQYKAGEAVAAGGAPVPSRPSSPFCGPPAAPPGGRRGREAEGPAPEYLKQLCMGSLRECAAGGSAPSEALDVEAVVLCVQGAADPQTRNAALLLLAGLAEAAPDRVLAHVLPVAAVLGPASLSRTTRRLRGGDADDRAGRPVLAAHGPDGARPSSRPSSPPCPAPPRTAASAPLHPPPHPRVRLGPAPGPPPPPRRRPGPRLRRARVRGGAPPPRGPRAAAAASPHSSTAPSCPSPTASPEDRAAAAPAPAKGSGKASARKEKEAAAASAPPRRPLCRSFKLAARVLGSRPSSGPCWRPPPTPAPPSRRAAAASRGRPPRPPPRAALQAAAEPGAAAAAHGRPWRRRPLGARAGRRAAPAGALRLAMDALLAHSDPAVLAERVGHTPEGPEGDAALEALLPAALRVLEEDGHPPTPPPPSGRATRQAALLAVEQLARRSRGAARSLSLRRSRASSRRWRGQRGARGLGAPDLAALAVELGPRVVPHAPAQAQAAAAAAGGEAGGPAVLPVAALAAMEALVSTVPSSSARTSRTPSPPASTPASSPRASRRCWTARRRSSPRAARVPPRLLLPALAAALRAPRRRGPRASSACWRRRAPAAPRCSGWTPRRCTGRLDLILRALELRPSLPAEQAPAVEAAASSAAASLARFDRMMPRWWASSSTPTSPPPRPRRRRRLRSGASRRRKLRGQEEEEGEGEGGQEKAGPATGPYEARVETLLAPCLAEMAMAAGSDALWKPLNHALLMATRSEDPVIRAAALRCFEVVAARVGEEYLVLLPESIPFLAELMEDADAGVEAEVRRAIKLLEEMSGESLQRYLSG